MSSPCLMQTHKCHPLPRSPGGRREKASRAMFDIWHQAELWQGAGRKLGLTAHHQCKRRQNEALPRMGRKPLAVALLKVTSLTVTPQIRFRAWIINGCQLLRKTEIGTWGLPVVCVASGWSRNLELNTDFSVSCLSLLLETAEVVEACRAAAWLCRDCSGTDFFVTENICGVLKFCLGGFCFFFF